MIVTTSERTIRQLEEKAFDPGWLKAVVDDADSGFLLEAAEEIAYVNRAYALLLGYDSPDDLLYRHVSLIVAEQDAPRLLEFGRMRARDECAPSTYHFDARCKDASIARLHASVFASRVGRKLVIATMVQPVPLPAVAEAPAEDCRAQQSLSAREIEVMEMILEGKRIKEIAFTLQLSPKTICTHRIRLLRKMNLTDNRDLFRYAVQHHLIGWS